MRRTLLTLLTALFLVSSLPASVGIHPLEGGDAGTGEDAPDHQAEAWDIEEGEVQGDLLPPLDVADWYRLEVSEPSRLSFDAWSDMPVKVMLVGPDNETRSAHGGSSYVVENTTGTWYIGLHAAILLPAHYAFFIKTAPVDQGPCAHDHCTEDEEPRPLSDDGANGTITQEDPADHYTISAAAYDLLTFSIEADDDSGIAVSVRAIDETLVVHEEHESDSGVPIFQPRHETHHYLTSDSAQWFQPYDADLLVTVHLVHERHKVCDGSGCEEYERIGTGGDYVLHVTRETDVPVPDLAIESIEEIRRPIRTDLTPDLPNVVNEHRTLVIDIANLGEGTSRWGGYVVLEMSKDRGPFFHHGTEVVHIPPLGPGERDEVRFEWDTTTEIGDYTIRAYVIPLPEWFDSDHRNNRAEHETYVKVGGLL